MKRLLWVFLIVFLSGCASGQSLQEMKAADPPKDDKLIVPGWRVGKVYLGMTSAALLTAMGEPDMASPYHHTTNFTWKNAGLSVQLDMEADSAINIEVFRESNVTAAGVRLGMSELAVTAKLGKPEHSYRKQVGEDSNFIISLYCYKRGIAVWFDTAVPHNVHRIEVMSSKEWRSIPKCGRFY